MPEIFSQPSSIDISIASGRHESRKHRGTLFLLTAALGAMTVSPTSAQP